MDKKMLIDASTADEVRVAVLGENGLEDFDTEILSAKQLRGNIYLAKITRVEPSLQAAFVEFGSNRQGFLAFSEIHPDYYRIPLADRQEFEAVLAARNEEDEDQDEENVADAQSSDEQVEQDVDNESEGERSIALSSVGTSGSETREGLDSPGETDDNTRENSAVEMQSEEGGYPDTESEAFLDEDAGDEAEIKTHKPAHIRQFIRRKNYKIQEVIKKNQIVLVQVVKEERGSKGAALTTYLSLAGRYSVLMPNAPGAGGVSRKISNPQDRKKMKEVLQQLKHPPGMSVILRTAGLERTKTEIKRDFDYLVKLWNEIREKTLQSIAPNLIYEEADLIKRALRDMYSRDIEEIWIAGEEVCKTAKSFMRQLMPSHARRIKLYDHSKNGPIFSHFQLDSHIDKMFQPRVALPSGGYLIINMTEALVAIDVNSGRATRERHIEETAFKTNMEAAQEAARQMRLQDLAGLVVIDFIDMEDDHHRRAVERSLKEAVKRDRARIQIGQISQFGLLELSRQRLRPSLLETHFEPCVHCGGTGIVMKAESFALSLLRQLEIEVSKQKGTYQLHLATSFLIYFLNAQRRAVQVIEDRHDVVVEFVEDKSLAVQNFQLLCPNGAVVTDYLTSSQQDIARDQQQKKRRGRRRGGKLGDSARSNKASDQVEAKVSPQNNEAASSADSQDTQKADAEANGEDKRASTRPKRRRGRRGGRNRNTARSQPQTQPSQDQGEVASPANENGQNASEQIALSGSQSGQKTASVEDSETTKTNGTNRPARRRSHRSRSGAKKESRSDDVQVSAPEGHTTTKAEPPKPGRRTAAGKTTNANGSAPSVIENRSNPGLNEESRAHEGKTNPAPQQAARPPKQQQTGEKKGWWRRMLDLDS